MSSTSARSTVLISVNDLPDAVNAGAQLLDVRWELTAPPGTGYQQYLDGHLPGALFADFKTIFTAEATQPELGRHPLPSAAQLSEQLGLLGIDDSRPVIVYDRPGSFAAERAWWVLRWAGLDARVLEGGITAWTKADGGLLTGESVALAPTSLQLTTGQLPTLSAAEVTDFDGVLIDARAGERFRGETEPIDARAGHIPGAINRPVGQFFDASGLLPSVEKLDALLELPADKEIAVYCGSGVSAARLLLALASVGIEASLYPPSWSGWSSDPERPVAVGE